MLKLSKAFKTAALLYCIFSVCCSGNKLPENVSGRLLLRLEGDDFCATLMHGYMQIHRLPSPDFVRTSIPPNITAFTNHSFSNDLRKMAYLDGLSRLHVFDIPRKTDIEVYEPSQGYLFAPVISPDGHFVAVTERQGNGNLEDYLITLINLEIGQKDKITFQNRLRGLFLLSPGPLRWVNDSSGFTYQRTSISEGKPVPEICFYDVRARKSKVLGRGIGGMLSPGKDKLLRLLSDDRKELQVLNLQDQSAYKFSLRKQSNQGIIDYTWSPDGRFVAVLIGGLVHVNIVITDASLRHPHIEQTHLEPRNWDSYFTPMRWLPPEST